MSLNADYGPADILNHGATSNQRILFCSTAAGDVWMESLKVLIQQQKAVFTWISVCFYTASSTRPAHILIFSITQS